MSKKIFLAFDIDGTIFDVSEMIVDSFQNGINNFLLKHKDLSIDMPSKEGIVSVLGIPIDEIFVRLFPSLTPPLQKEMNEFCTETLVKDIRLGYGKIFFGVEEVLQQFYQKGYTLTVASNGRSEYIEAILKTYGLLNLFSKPIAYLNNELDSKSHIVKYYIDNLLSKDDLIIMIGDRFTDREAAESNNIPFVGCSFGHTGDVELKGIKWIVHDFREIPDVVEQIIKSYFN